MRSRTRSRLRCTRLPIACGNVPELPGPVQEFVKNQVRLQGGNILGPKVVCINIQPYGSTQAPERTDILNIGGFSDAVFNVVASYLGDDANRFVAEVDSIEL